MKEHEEESIQRLKNDIIMLKKLSVNHEKIESEIRNEYRNLLSEEKLDECLTKYFKLKITSLMKFATIKQ